MSSSRPFIASDQSTMLSLSLNWVVTRIRSPARRTVPEST